MSKTTDVGVTVIFDTEEQYDQFVDDLMALSEPFSGAVSGRQWDSLPEDES